MTPPIGSGARQSMLGAVLVYTVCAADTPIALCVTGVLLIRMVNWDYWPFQCKSIQYQLPDTLSNLEPAWGRRVPEICRRKNAGVIFLFRVQRQSKARVAFPCSSTPCSLLGERTLRQRLYRQREGRRPPASCHMQQQDFIIYCTWF